ncbi:hypothetical protein D3C79_437960 [compost metagenome]
MADAALGQGLQVGDRLAVAVGQPQELAAVRRQGALIVAGQIPDMGLVDGDVGRVLLAVGRLQAVPARRLEGRIVQVHHLAELGVHGEAQGIGVGHLIGFQLAAEGVIDLDGVAVVLAHQIRAALQAPAAAGLVLCHGALAEGLMLLIEQRQLDRLGGRRPQPEGDVATLDHGAIAQLGGGLGIDCIQGAGALHQGGPLQYALGIGTDRYQLTLEQGLEILTGRQGEGGGILEVRILGLLLGTEAGRGQAEVGEVEHPFRIGLDGAGLCVVEPHMGFVLAPLPDQGVAVDQVGAGPGHAEGGAEGLGTAAEDLALARNYGHGAIRVLAEDHLHVGAGQVRHIAVAGDEVDAAFHLGERHHPAGTEAVHRRRCLAGVIPARVQAAVGGGITGIVVPQVQAVAGEGPFDAARRAGLGVDQGDHRLIGPGHQLLGRRLYIGEAGDGPILGGWSGGRGAVVITARQKREQ